MKIEGNTATARRPLSLHEAAEFLGISHHSLYKYVQRREIPHLRIGHIIKFDPSVLEDWVFNVRRVDPIEPKRRVK